MRYLVYHPHPTPEESEAVGGLMLTVQLNLAATKLRCAREAAALTHCEKALELQPEHPKALYRSAQAHTQLGQPAQAKAFLARLEAAAQGDEEMLKAAAQERARLEHRQERHKRQQKKAYARMVQGHDDAPRGPHRWWRLLRSWAERDDYAGAMALAGAAVVAAFAAALLLLPDWGSTTRQ
jgi:tetratricopeptide (TPR) repeat protein